MPPVKKPKIKTAAPAEAKENTEKTVISGQLEKQLDKKKNKRKRKYKSNRGVVLIKNLPRGFFEEQLKKYFCQFGRVTRLRLARSKLTGGSKSFAFVEFEFPEVAQVAAETMSNYLMFKKVVKTAYIPPEQQQFDYFKTSVRKVKNKGGKEVFVSQTTKVRQQNVKKQNNWSEDAFQKRTAAQLKKVNKLKKKYPNLGIDFSKILVEPKKWSAEAEQKETDTTLDQSIDNTDVVSSTSQAVIKRKKEVKNKNKSAVKTKKSKTNKKELELADLLSDTINDDSEDEDYIAVPNSDESADEFVDASSDENDEIIPTESDEDEEEEVKRKIVPKSLKTNKAKSLEAKCNIDKLIKRKPQTGGIQKKLAKKPALSKAKNSVQLAAAKELVKSLPKGKMPTKIKATAKKGKSHK